MILITDFVSQKAGKEITLLELYKRSKIHLIIVTICLNSGKACYLDHIKYPDLSLIKAIKMSSSLPGIFPPVEHNGKLYIDGALVDNNPIHLLGDGAWGICQSNDPESEIEEIKNMFDYTVYIIRTIYNNVNNVKRKSNQKLIKIEIDISVTSFDISKDTKLELFKNGMESTRIQLNHIRLIDSITHT